MTYPLSRQSPSGPKLDNLKNGAVIQMVTENTLVTTGTIAPGAPREVQTVIGGATPTLRPVLEAPNPTSRIFVEGDVDIVFDDAWVSQNLTSSVEVSFNEGTTWDVVGGAVMAIPSTIDAGTTPSGTRVRTHFKVSSPEIEIATLPGFAAGADITARVTFERDPTSGACSVVTDSDGPGTVRLAIVELYFKA